MCAAAAVLRQRQVLQNGKRLVMPSVRAVPRFFFSFFICLAVFVGCDISRVSGPGTVCRASSSSPCRLLPFLAVSCSVGFSVSRAGETRGRVRVRILRNAEILRCPQGLLSCEASPDATGSFRYVSLFWVSMVTPARHDPGRIRR